MGLETNSHLQDTNISAYKESEAYPVSILYEKRGVRVSRQAPIIPQWNGRGFSHSDLSPLHYAVKENIPGYFNAQSLTDPSVAPFADEQIYDPADLVQIENPRHPAWLLANERAILNLLGKHPTLSMFAPMLFESEPNKVVTEFVEGNLLKQVIDTVGLHGADGAYVASQVMDFIYYLHSLNLQHNDLHGKNIILQPNAKITIIDFGMTGADLNPTPAFQDINELNKLLIRLSNPPGTFKRHNGVQIRPLNEQELDYYGWLKDFVMNAPFDEGSFMGLYEEYLSLMQSPHGLLSSTSL